MRLLDGLIAIAVIFQSTPKFIQELGFLARIPVRIVSANGLATYGDAAGHVRQIELVASPIAKPHLLNASIRRRHVVSSFGHLTSTPTGARPRTHAKRGAHARVRVGRVVRRHLDDRRSTGRAAHVCDAPLLQISHLIRLHEGVLFAHHDVHP